MYVYVLAPPERMFRERAQGLEQEPTVERFQQLQRHDPGPRGQRHGVGTQVCLVGRSAVGFVGRGLFFCGLIGRGMFFCRRAYGIIYMHTRVSLISSMHILILDHLFG